MAPSSEAAPPLVLITEDDEVAFVIARVLGTGRPLERIATYDAGAERIARDTPEVLLIDGDVGNGRGVDLVAQARARRPWCHVLALAGPPHETVPRLITAGAADLMTKPFDVGSLPSRIERLARAAREARAEFAERDRLAQRLQHADRLVALGTAFATLAHEVANPLAAVVANVELIAISLAAESAQPLAALERGELLDAARDAVAASRMIRTVLEHARGFARREEATAVAPLGRVVDTALAMLRPRIAASGVVITRPAGAGPVTAFRPARLSQALINALGNALDASSGMPGAGRVEMTWADEPDVVGIVVRDDGAGMTPEQIAHATQAFVTSKARGLGLGLMVMRDVMRDHGGQLRLGPRADGTRGLEVALLVPRAATGG